MTTQQEIATALGITKGRCSQLVKIGMPTDSVESARAWRANRKNAMENAGHISQPVRPLNLGDLDGILRSLSREASSSDNSEMDIRIQQQVELCQMTRTVFMQALQGGDPAQGKLYSNYDRAIGTLLSLEKVRHHRLQEEGRLIDAGEASARFGKILGQLRSQIERAELTVAPKANPENPPKALKAFREFRDDLFRRMSEYNVEVRDGSPAIGEDEVDTPTGDVGVGDSTVITDVNGEALSGNLEWTNDEEETE